MWGLLTSASVGWRWRLYSWPSEQTCNSSDTNDRNLTNGYKWIQMDSRIKRSYFAMTGHESSTTLNSAWANSPSKCLQLLQSRLEDLTSPWTTKQRQKCKQSHNVTRCHTSQQKRKQFKLSLLFSMKIPRNHFARVLKQPQKTFSTGTHYSLTWPLCVRLSELLVVQH